IEAGVDVPKASIMIIEHAERFGLSQLHQLRGRVGRGAKESSCILLYRQPLSDTARERLNVMRSTEDGFVIAEEDLRLRGGGEVLGTRQSGFPLFLIAAPPEHQALLEAARDQARLTLARDPELKGGEAARLRLLLYLFERDDAIKLMRAGCHSSLAGIGVSGLRSAVVGWAWIICGWRARCRQFRGASFCTRPRRCLALPQ